MVMMAPKAYFPRYPEGHEIEIDVIAEDEDDL